MQFHISNVLSEFDARFDDAMLRRSFIGRRQGDHGSRGRVSPENSPGHPANAPGGGVDTGDHDGDEKYGSDASSSSRSRGKVSPENSPGHPANAPGGGGVATGDHDGDEKYGSDAGRSSSPSNDNSPGHPANAPGGSSSGGRVSPENSRGHPANAPTTGGTTDSGDGDTGGGSTNFGFESPNLQTGRNDVDSDGDGVTDHVVMVQEDGIERWYAADDRYREGYATGEYRFARTRDDGTRFEAQVDDEGRFQSERTHGAFTYEDGTTITHRDTTGDGRADAMVSNRPDGSVEIIRDIDGDGSPDQVMVEDASGLVHIYSAEEWAKERQRRGEYSGEETGEVTQANSEAAWDAHKPTIDRALAVLNDGGTPAALKAAAAEVAQIAAAWRGSGVAADDGGLMADHLDGLAQSLSESSRITQANNDQRAEFEKVFREATGREPSGDLVKDADILSRYGENAATDMGYAADVQAFERTFREVTKREPSGDLQKDADILSRYGENPLTDMGYAGDVRAFENAFRETTGREPSGDLVQDAAVFSQYGENPLTDMGYAADVQAFERTFREVTKREPSGDLAKDADILSRYGENPLTDMGYAAELQAFEKTFREVTGREPSGDLVKDADILSRYGENALTDMGHTSEPPGQVHTWGGKEVVYLDSENNPTDDESNAMFRIVTDENGVLVGEFIDRYDPSDPWAVRSRYDEEGKRYESLEFHPHEWLGASDQNQAAAEIVDQHMVGRHIDEWGTIELPDQNRTTTKHAGGPRGRGTTTQVEIRGVPQKYIVDWDEKGNPILAPGWEEAVVPLSLNRSRIEGLNPDNTYKTGDPTLWARAKPWVSVVPGASTLIKLSDIKHPGSAGGSQITGREWREFGSEALVDSVYVFGWPYGAINLARGVGTAALKGGLKAAGRQTLHMARPDRLAKTMLWEPSLPNVTRIVTRQGVNTVRNLRNPLTSIGTKARGSIRGVISETGEELLVEYPFEVASPHIFGVADPGRPLFTGDWSNPLSIRPGAGLIPSKDDAISMGGSVGVFGVLEGVGARRFRPGGDVAIPTFEAPQSAGRRDFGNGGQHLPGGTRWQPSGEMRRHHHLPHEPSAGFHEGAAFDAWPSGWESLMPPAPSGYQRSGSGLLLPTPTPATAPATPSWTPGSTPTPTPTPTPSNPPTPTDAILRSSFPDPTASVVPPTPQPEPDDATEWPTEWPTPTDQPRLPTPPTWTPLVPSPTPPFDPPTPLPPTPTVPSVESPPIIDFTPPPPEPPTPIPAKPESTPTPTPGKPDPTPTPGPSPVASPSATPTPDREGAGSTTVDRASEGLYPRIIAHDEVVRVYHDLDTGEIVTQPLATPTEPVIILEDNTPPPVGTRFAGHRSVTPRGAYVFTSSVGKRRKKASPQRHPYLRRGELRRR